MGVGGPTVILTLLSTLCARAHRLQLPNGATYSTRFRIPLIGHQQVNLIVYNSTVATVSLDGLVRCDGDVVYTVDARGNVDFEMDDALTRFMRRYGCAVSNGQYDAAEDVAHITLRLPMFALVRTLRMQRTLPPSTKTTEGRVGTTMRDRLARNVARPVLLLAGLQRFCGTDGGARD